MKTTALALLLLLPTGSALAQQDTSTTGDFGAWTRAAAPAAKVAAPAIAAPRPAAVPCLLVKHKGTIGRRLMWTALIGIPIAPGSKYDYVDGINMSATKTSFSGKDLQKFEGSGVHVVVLNNKFSAADLDAARRSCSGSLQ